MRRLRFRAAGDGPSQSHILLKTLGCFDPELRNGEEHASEIVGRICLFSGSSAPGRITSAFDRRHSVDSFARMTAERTIGCDRNPTYLKDRLKGAVFVFYGRHDSTAGMRGVPTPAWGDWGTTVAGSGPRSQTTCSRN
jgi:hypothetical protein